MQAAAATMSSETPVYQLAQNTYLKLENLNLGGSHKTRSARWMIESAVKSKLLNGKANQVIIEKTGGNLGIGLAIEANRRGIPLELAVGLSFSAHKRALLEHYGASLIGKEMMNDGAQPREVIEWHLGNQEQLGKDYVFLDQFKNEANLHAHLFETGPEIADYIAARGLGDKHIYLVCGVGSGASLSGIGLALKQRFGDVTICAVQPAGCDMEKGVFVNHGLEGLAVGVKPPI